MYPPETAKAGAAPPNPALLLSDIYQIPSANRVTHNGCHSAAEHSWTHTDAGQRQEEEDTRCDDTLNTLN